MIALLRDADDVLRARPWTSLSAGGRPARAMARLLVVLVSFGAVYGAVMGGFGGLRGDRWLQVLSSAAKVPVLLAATTALGVPSFFVLHALFGLASDFGRALRAVVTAQAALTVTLASLAPLTALWYASNTDYRSAILFNAAMFAAASLGAQLVLRRAYRPLIARDGRHRHLLRAWLVVYALVGIQMGWLLRPFIGNPGGPVELFRDETWGNAYEFVGRLILEKLR